MGEHADHHGTALVAGIRIESYSLESEDADGLVGDQASQTAFRDVLRDFLGKADAAREPALHGIELETVSNEELDALFQGSLTGSPAKTPARHVLAMAIDEFSARLTYVIGRFAQHPSWQGVERVVIGGGFKESVIGRMAIRWAAQRVMNDGLAMNLRLIHHPADEAGLVGWAVAAPPTPAVRRPGTTAILDVDIGGTNVRCGIVGNAFGGRDDAHVLAHEEWNHAEVAAQQDDLVEGIVAALRRLVAQAKQDAIRLAPFIGIGCPGIIRQDGSIERGAQNLPGDWQGASFHLPRRICENIPEIHGHPTVARMHNDAVLQGLSEAPFTRDVPRWAVLTIGTGLGNASFRNLANHNRTMTAKVRPSSA